MKKVAYIASECVPFIKTGGLADVVGTLPKMFDRNKYDVRIIIPKFLGRMLSTSCRRRSFSSVVFIFAETEILSPKGMSTMYRPVNVISVVSRGPLDDIGSLTICTRSSCPG